jgi:hypothetical protein
MREAFREESTAIGSSETLDDVHFRKPGGVPTKVAIGRRAAHHQAVVNDLCDIVADLFIAESKVETP